MQSEFSEPRAAKDRQRDITSAKSSYRSAQTNTSVRKHDAARDCDLGKLIYFLQLGTYKYMFYLLTHFFFIKFLTTLERNEKVPHYGGLGNNMGSFSIV